MNRSAFILAIILGVATSAIAQRNIYDAGGVPQSLQQTLVERLTLFTEAQRTGDWDKVAEMLGELSNGVSRSKYTAEQKQWVIERLKENPMISLVPKAVSFSTANLNRPLRLRWWYVEGEGKFLHSDGTEKVVIAPYRDRKRVVLSTDGSNVEWMDPAIEACVEQAIYQVNPETSCNPVKSHRLSFSRTSVSLSL